MTGNLDETSRNPGNSILNTNQHPELWTCTVGLHLIKHYALDSLYLGSYSFGSLIKSWVKHYSALRVIKHTKAEKLALWGSTTFTIHREGVNSWADQLTLKCCNGSKSKPVLKTYTSRGLLTVKAAVLCTVLKKFAVGLVGRLEDEHPGVEAIGPSGIWSCWELFSVKQLIYIR